MRLGWRDRLTDPWYVLPMCVLAGAVLALALAMALQPDDDSVGKSVIAASSTPASTPTPDPMARYHDLGRGIDAFKIVNASFQYYRDNKVYRITPSTASRRSAPTRRLTPAASLRRT